MSNYADITIKSNTKFLKIEEGIPKTIRLLGDAVETMVHGGGKDEIICNGANCLKCAENDEPKQRFNTNVFDHGSQKVMIWKYGPGVAKQIREVARLLADDKVDITSVDLKVSATGSQMQKRYTVMASPQSKQVPSGLKLHELQGDIPF